MGHIVNPKPAPPARSFGRHLFEFEFVQARETKQVNPLGSFGGSEGPMILPGEGLNLLLLLYLLLYLFIIPDWGLRGPHDPPRRGSRFIIIIMFIFICIIIFVSGAPKAP